MNVCISLYIFLLYLKDIIAFQCQVQYQQQITLEQQRTQLLLCYYLINFYDAHWSACLRHFLFLGLVILEVCLQSNAIGPSIVSAKA